MYFVGINIGTDRTTVSRAPGYNGAPVSRVSLRRDAGFAGETVKTAVCKKDGKWSLVYDACDFWFNDSRYVLKDLPSRMSDDDREAMRVFAKLIFKTIIEHDIDLRYDPTYDEKNFELGIACPFDWVREDPNAQQEYLDFFRNECGIPVDSCMIETDAIYGSVIQKPYFDINDEFVIIDLESNTIDFSAYVKFRCADYWGCNLGTHRIVDALMPHILQFENNSENLQKLKEFRHSMGFDGDVLTQLSLFVPEQVERYFIENRDVFSLSVRYDDLTTSWNGDRWDRCIRFAASRDEFNEIIAGYLSAVKEALIKARIRLNQSGIIPNKVFITGDKIGSEYIKEYAKEIFDGRVYIDLQPEYNISHGIALLMYHNAQSLEWKR